MKARGWTTARLTVACVGASFAIVAVACADRASDDSHPAELVGRWVRLRADQSWGDTMEFRPDGKLLGSTGYPVPARLEWQVKRNADGVLEYCAAEGGNGFCRAYHLDGDTLDMIGGPQGNTIFRRVR